jgi:DNA-binding response OmpR family regulator
MSSRKRLLVVDDEKMFADFVVKTASDLDYAALATNSGRDFKEAFLAEAPDVIVLDILMPDEDGIELMQWLVKNGCRARIIICSGYGSAFANITKALGEHQSNLQISILAKPVRLKELRAYLSETPSADQIVS